MKKKAKSQEEQILDEMEAVQKSYDEVNEVLNQETKEVTPSSPQEQQPTPEEIQAGGMLNEDPAPDAADQGLVADNYKDVPKLKVDADQDAEEHGRVHDIEVSNFLRLAAHFHQCRIDFAHVSA